MSKEKYIKFMEVDSTMHDMSISISEKVRGKGTDFDRIRRITGYLVGTLDRFNSGKAAEERDRVKHGIVSDCSCTSQMETVSIKESVYA